MKLRIVNKSRHDLPEYQTGGASAFDVKANIDKPFMLGSLDRVVVPTGLFMAIPEGYEIQVRPRSGLSAKHGISLVNAPGTIDSDYRGELGVIMINLSKEPYTICDGDRIAQLVLARSERVEFELVEELDETERGNAGFGHTGR